MKENTDKLDHIKKIFIKTLQSEKSQLQISATHVFNKRVLKENT